VAFPAALALQVRNSILDLWSAGKAFVTYSLQLKFGYFLMLPHAVLVLGHHDLNIVRAKLRIAYGLFLQTQTQDHNYYVLALFSPESELHRDTYALMFHDGPMTPGLEVMAAKFMLIKCAERSIERPHRIAIIPASTPNIEAPGQAIAP